MEYWNSLTSAIKTRSSCNRTKTIDIVLQPDTEVLEEVVVVGYGSQKKESVVGAISTLDVTKLTVPGSSISNALAGQLSGIVAMSRSGEPGKIARQISTSEAYPPSKVHQLLLYWSMVSNVISIWLIQMTSHLSPF